ncbi:DUF4265 domain-containing protein [Nonomuraea sp. PA05]|uniref:DUF4265 domain-containing protein n=1 Tax=Nonomuraea sp. PA05 TaxID=2604466 RepID=UPI0011DB058E|nr:DUF4265 domain-containing protein [Nonomuraea sp. PA05]TYB61392.1 DUF4265 domain-containing protein [Nonomuraea sp. PA05]
MMIVMDDEVEQIKIWFRFVPREGWFPQDTEGLWADRLSADAAQVKNVPFLLDGVAEGDVVRFQTDSDGLHWAVERVSASGNCTIRVVPIPSGPLGRSAHAVHQRFAQFELGGETFSEDFPMVALNAPAGADFTGIKALLTCGQENGWWHYELGCVTDEWRNA